MAVELEHVLDDRARLAHHDRAVLEHRQLPERRLLRERLGRALELDAAELVRDLELLEQPTDTDRARPRREPERDHTSS